VLAEIAAPFEEILHLGIMVVTQAAHGHVLPVSLQFPSDIVVLAAVAGLQRETSGLGIYLDTIVVKQL
jgi:hypothetical protein